MEEYSLCPTNFSDQFQNPMEIEKCIGWEAPTYGTSDYYNSCAISTNVGIPLNAVGEQSAFNGNGYLGAYFTSYTGGAGTDGYSGIMWWEYIQGKTTKPLDIGKIYKMSLEVSLAEYSDLMITEIGAYFSNYPITGPNTSAVTLEPYCIFYDPEYFKDTANWIHLEALFMANGGEQYLTIGNFHDNLTTDTTRRYDLYPDINPNVTYMYVDHVVLTEASIEIPNVFTPNGDGVNDLWEISVPGSAQNKVYILNRWGNLVYESGISGLKWDGKTQDGSEVSEGTYFYRIDNSNIAGFIELVR